MLNRSRIISVATVLALTPVASANAFIFGDDMDQARAMTPNGTSFEGELAREYRDFFLFEADEMYDWPDADYFAEKALAANKGKTVLPEDPKDWNIDSRHEPGLIEARGKLVGVLEKGAREVAPHEAAVAQARFDCWVEQQEEGHQLDDIAACRNQFHAALAKLDEAMQPKTAEAPIAEPLAVKPVAALVVGDEVARTVVYFGWDKARIAGDEQTKLNVFVDEMKRMRNVVLYLEGHADRSGPADYNLELSKVRAEQVRGELVKQGLNVAEIEDFKLGAEGESQPAVITQDGIREPGNRRVEVVARGAVATIVPPNGESKLQTQ